MSLREIIEIKYKATSEAAPIFQQNLILKT